MPMGVPHACYDSADPPARALFRASPADKLEELFDALHDLTDIDEAMRPSALQEVDFVRSGRSGVTPMRLGRGQWRLRALGVLFGLGLGALGAFSYFGGGPSLPEPVEERAAGFGITLMVVGAIAIAGSLLAQRVDRLWYRKPPRWRMMHGQPTDWRKWWRP